MSAHSLAIAKASLAAGMMRPDPAPVTRAEITQLHDLLEASLSQCTAAAIQRCKDWLLKNAIPSAVRTTAIGKYLVALSASLGLSLKDAENTGPGPSRKVPSRRKQLHILYLLSDLLHHTKYHVETSSTYSTLTGNLQPHLVDLFGYASAYDPDKFRRHHRKLQELLDIWGQKDYYQIGYIDKLRETVNNAARLGYNGGNEESRQRNGIPEDHVDGSRKDAPYIMPASHGDTSTPYYDLPAGNMMPHIVPNSSAPINPQLMKPLQFVAGPADETLAVAIKDFMKDVEVLYGTGVGEGNDVGMDIDELGQPAIRDEITGEMIEGEGYYGWSRAFCEKIKRRRDGKESLQEESRRSRSADRSASPLKRRGYSYSGSSRSRSRSLSLDRSGDVRRRIRKHSFSRSRSSSRSRQGFRARKYNRPTSHRRASADRRSRTRSYSPNRDQPVISGNSQPPPLPQVQSSAPHPFPGSFGGIPIGSNGFPTPPPPPPNYTGPWPPPPPPHQVHPSGQAGPYLPFSALVPPPPPSHPPPPVDPHPQGAFQHGYVPAGNHGSFPQVPATWPQQQGSNNSKGAYGGRGGFQSGRGYRDGWQ